ncbi:MAG: carboxypeptidase-like regulatory domain-containing protein [Nitrosotalea sp.]
MKSTQIMSISVAILVFVVAFSSNHVSYSALTYSMLVNVKLQNNPINQGDYPVIMGNVTDQAYRPVANANVFILFGSEAVTTTTDNQGNFRYQSAIQATSGTYEVDVTVTKPGYIKQLASTTYTVNPPPTTTTYGNLTTNISNTLNGLPVTTGNYTVFLGTVPQWNLETTCMVDFSNKHMRFLKTCDLYNLEPQDFQQQDDQIIPTVTVIQYNDTYRLFPDGIYKESFYMGNATLNSFVKDTWQSYVAPN